MYDLDNFKITINGQYDKKANLKLKWSLFIDRQVTKIDRFLEKY